MSLLSDVITGYLNILLVQLFFFFNISTVRMSRLLGEFSWWAKSKTMRISEKCLKEPRESGPILVKTKTALLNFIRHRAKNLNC